MTDQPTLEKTLTHAEALQMVQAAIAPLQQGIEALIKKALSDHEGGLPGVFNPISLKELNAEHAMVRPQTLLGPDGPHVVLLTRRPVAAPDGLNRYKLIAHKHVERHDDLPTEEGHEHVSFSLTLFQEHPIDITMSTVVEPTPAIEAELLRQLSELASSFDGAAVFHVSILVLNMDPVEVPDMPTPQ